MAERIRQDVEKARKDELPVTVSIGVSSYPEHGVELESLIRAADDATYRAKQLEKNRVAVAELSFAGSGSPEKNDG